jgi:thiol-disulfide isomerase/thioredoxin
MSILLQSKKELNDCLKTNSKLAVLFYASWCPFSQRFLPQFEKRSTGQDHLYRRVVVDDLADLVNKYAIEVYPTVLYFENGKVVRRLDGEHGVGLDENQLNEFIIGCKIK